MLAKAGPPRPPPAFGRRHFAALGPAARLRLCGAGTRVTLGVVRLSWSLVVAALALPAASQPTVRAPERPRWIVLCDDATTFPARRRLLWRLRAACLGRPDAGDVEEAAAVVALLERGARRAHAALARRVRESGGRWLHDYWIVNGGSFEASAATAAALAGAPGVRSVRRERRYGPSIKRITNAKNHNADAVQALGAWGKGVAIALLDSGIDTTLGPGQGPHPAFVERTNPKRSRIAAAVGIARAGDFEDLNGHGSAVAAIAAGRDWGAKLVASDHGYAPDASIVSYKITQGISLNTTDSWLVAAWQQVATDRARYGIVAANLSYNGNPDPTAPDQQALDAAAFFADVLVATSAGNFGRLSLPTNVSASNANGLAVGAIQADNARRPHSVAPFSSFGPLPGDGARYFPDLAAVGVGIVSVLVDAPVGFTVNEGTSFSAPQVAGTAAVLRALDPGLSALDVKALILNSTADLRAANPGLGRWHYGLGMLRTDLAYETWRKGTIRRGSLMQTGQQVAFPVQVQAGKSYAATLAWPRVDPTRWAWDDLDLRLDDPGGATVALSASKRNLYEHLRFRPARSGTFTLRVLATDLRNGTPPLPFSLVFGENRGGGRQAGSYETFGTGCAGTGENPGQGLVLPRAARTGAGNARTHVPFSYTPTRFQQAFDRAEFAAGLTVRGLAFRRDEQQGETPSYDVDLEIDFAYTSRAPGALSTKFAANIDPGTVEKVFRRRTIRVHGARRLPRPGEWDLRIPLDAPFVARPPKGRHLLLDVRVHSHSMGNRPFAAWWDALQGRGLTRIYSDKTPQAAAGVRDDLNLVVAFMRGGPGRLPPRLQTDGAPQLGESFAVVLRDAPPHAPAGLAHGWSRTTWNGAPLPLDLGPFGAPGCRLLTDWFLLIGAPADAVGQSAVRYTIPNDPNLTGVGFYQQFLVLDPAANGLGLAVSNGGWAITGG